MFEEQFYYGHREILLEYSGLPSDFVFEAIVSHGDLYPFEDKRIPFEFDLKGDPLLQLEWRSDAELVAAELGVQKVLSIGAVGAYELLNQGIDKSELKLNLSSFSEDFNWPQSQKLQAKRLNEHSSVIYFPEHSWVGDVLSYVIDKNNPLLSLNPSAVTVCLGWGDFTSPKVRSIYKNLGWRIECAGISNNVIPMSPMGGRSTFMKSLFELIRSHEIVVADQLTTGLFYAALLNKSCGILSVQDENELEFSYWRNLSQIASFHEKSKKHFGWLWGDEEVQSKIFNDVNVLLGIDSIKPPDFFRDDVKHFSLKEWVY
jgi:hypothetical protein